ncbi:hypothetical protein [Methylocaldum sp. GT1BB]|jgi:hypothetical protein|uniref:hypothetical protein n=1 Tax=Methylocaldum sp. GT1BB TaxID=3438963 RepID=UPI003DA1B959
MNPAHLLDTIQRTLTNGHCTLDQIWLDHAPIWQRLGWSREQVSLYLACLPGVRQCSMPTGEKAYELESSVNASSNKLADELVALLAKAGRPMPLAQLLGKLPAGMVVTEPMLRAAAMQDARLELRGPLVKLA